MAGMRRSLWLLPLVVAGCTRSVVDEAFYAPQEVELILAMSEGGEAWVVPVASEEIDDWNWSWQERFPQLVEARASAPDGEATLPRPHYAPGPLAPTLPRITVSEAEVDRVFNGGWRAKIRISYRDPRQGVTWSQSVRLDEEGDGRWRVDLGANPLTGLPHHADVILRETGVGGGAESGAS